MGRYLELFLLVLLLLLCTTIFCGWLGHLLPGLLLWCLLLRILVAVSVHVVEIVSYKFCFKIGE